MTTSTIHACDSCSRVDALDDEGRCAHCAATANPRRVASLRESSRVIGRQLSALHAAGASTDTLRALRGAARACDEELEALTLGPRPAASTMRAAGQRSLVEDLELSVAVYAAGREVA